MLKSLRFFLLLLTGLSLWAAQPAAASHLQGGDLTYAALGNNRYRVTLHIYRDCSGILPSPFTLECRNGGCNTAATVTAPFVQVGAAIAGRQYCATLTGICGGTVTNSEAYTYSVDVTLPPAAHWVLSTSQSARPSTTNLAAPGDFYLEATLNSLVPVGGTTGVAIANNSSVASALPVSYIPWNRLSNVSNNAFDADGDSLVYTQESPLEACGTAAAYAPYPQPGGLVVISTSPLCIFQTPTISNYSAAVPVYVAYDTTGTCPLKTGTPLFHFNASNGSIQLQPARYIPSASAVGDNKYAAVVKITEFRRINGSYVQVGTTRRELYFVVYDCGTNTLPRLGPAVTIQTGTGSGSQNVVQPFGRIIPVLAGEPVSVLVTASDANAAQTLTLSLDYNAAPGTTLQNLGGGQARLTFTPPLSLPTGLYRVAVTAEDNACPLKGLDSQVLTFRVTGTALATRTSTALAVAAFPNPFTDQVQFQLATPGVQALTICDYLGRTVATVRSQADGTVRWQPAPGLPAGLYLARTAGSTQTVRLLHNAAQ
ncbi:T9SS type A sorting domain-containing protein [Hymenobacter terricola]|uniref:T9SS type A sorting domain-containing protein n=1 Tax=Hymenobacter terricola TaxID=2819236 RepID=UPI001B3135C6|nr:T9SS type A sorting domain-containing protein [Hymenobacter terricola]